MKWAIALIARKDAMSQASGIEKSSIGRPPVFSYDAIMTLTKTTPVTGAFWLFGAFAVAFAVKVPMFPFHTWLPDAHVEAPTAGSVILAAIMLKMGTFGFIRFAVPLFPEVAMHPTVRTVMLVLAELEVERVMTVLARSSA